LSSKNCKGKTSAQVAKNSAIRSFIKNEQKRRDIRAKNAEKSGNSVPINKGSKKKKNKGVTSFEEYKRQKNKITPDSF